MRIVWHGHSCFEIESDITLVTDPHDGKSLGIKAPVVGPDLVLISHDHFDHNCSRALRGDFQIVREAGDVEVKGVRIRGLEAYHDDDRGKKRGKVIIYRFELDGVSFCHLGDLGHPLSDEQVEAIGRVDVLFIPVGGIFTIDGKEARAIVERIRPRVAIPMHFRMGGLSLSIQTVDAFLEGLPESAVFRVGNEMDVFPEELPGETEYWVFSP